MQRGAPHIAERIYRCRASLYRQRVDDFCRVQANSSHIGAGWLRRTRPHMRPPRRARRIPVVARIPLAARIPPAARIPLAAKISRSSFLLRSDAGRRGSAPACRRIVAAFRSGPISRSLYLKRCWTCFHSRPCIGGRRPRWLHLRRVTACLVSRRYRRYPGWQRAAGSAGTTRNW
jgi:hypothetical protein